MPKLRKRKTRERLRDHADLNICGKLTPNEKMLFVEVREGDTDRAIALLKNLQENLDLEKRDFYGRTVLSYAVIRQNEELVDFMTGSQFPEERKPVFLGDSLAYAIEGRNYSIAEKLLTYAEAMDWLERDYQEAAFNSHVSTKKSKQNFEKREATSCFISTESFGLVQQNVSVKFTDDVLRNPIIKASIIDDYPIIQMLYEKGFRVVVDGRPEDEKAIARLNRFKAYCSPGYLSVNELDAIEVCFKKSGTLESLAEKDPVYTVEYEQLAAQLRHYAVNLLNQCRGDKEIKLIMSKFNEKYDEEKKTADPGVFRFPRLEEAIKYEQKEFIAHPHSQKVITEMWRTHGGTEMSYMRLFLNFMLQIIFVPLSSIYLLCVVTDDWSIRKVYPKEKRKENLNEVESNTTDSSPPKTSRWEKFENIYLKSPISSFLRYYGTYLIFVILLAVEVLEPNLTNETRNSLTYGCSLDVLEYLIIIFVAGYTKHIITLIYLTGASFFTKFQNITYLFSVVFFFLAYIIWVVGFLITSATFASDGVDVNLCQKNTIPRYLYTSKHTYVLASEICFMIAVIGSYLKVLEVCHINRYLGIMQYILFQTFKDATYILFMFLLFIICFTLGLQMIYFNYQKDNWRIKINDLTGLPECNNMHEEFTDFQKTLKTLSWDLFGYGQASYANIMQPNIRDTSGKLLEPQKMDEMRLLLCNPQLTKIEWHKISKENNISMTFESNFELATEFFGYLVDFLYHGIVIILLLNLLVAKMSQTYVNIFKNADKEWKFQRTIYLARFMDYSEYVPPPFNLLPRLHLLLELAGKFKHVFKHLTKRHLKTEKKTPINHEYHEFEDILHHRLIHKQLEERSANAEVLELSKELVQDTNAMLCKIKELKDLTLYSSLDLVD